MAEKKGSKDAPEESQGSGKKKKIIIISVVATVLLLVLIAGAAAVFFFLTGNEGEDKKQSRLEVPVPELDKSSSIGPMVNIDEFIVNIISAENSHYVKASFTLELNNEVVSEEVERRMPQIRDSILLLLGNKTYDELQDLQGKKQLKAELTSKINSFLVTGRVKSIYFTQFVVQ
ncbi:MAG TPA: flagellar basal body-associated FliL family protein [Desulfopila sp.]|nr:flagellar basal body-associated FliL family protein [Desulfopila sp.]